jgi:glycosyltransferase involved in cell wall biosynthesis
MSPADLTISVIIPLYNGERFIAQALDSVFLQSLPPTEVIVVDDGSTDSGPEIVSRYAAARTLVFLRKPNGGQSSARNFGIAHSKGKVIALLDQDDIWYPDHLMELSRPFSEDVHQTLGWAYSNLDEISDDNRLRIRAVLSPSTGAHPKTRLDRCLGQDMFVLPSASVISRAAFDAAGGFDEDLSGYEDDDLFVRLFVAGYRNVYVAKPLGQWRVHATSASHTARMARSRMLYARKLLRAFPDEPALSHFYARDHIAPRFLGQVIDATRVALRSGDQETIDGCVEDASFLETYIYPGQKSLPIRQDLLITAVIPLYNGASFIREALQSVFGQILPVDEIIVVDDGSTDDGPDIVAAMAKQHPVRLLRKENGGQSSARNLGVDHAHGDLIAFLDQDDIWYPNHIAELVKPFLQQRATGLGWSYSDLDEIDEAGEMVRRAIFTHVNFAHPKRDLANCLRQDMFVLPSATIVSRGAFKSVGGFDERLSGYEDDDLFLRLFRAGFENVFISEPLSKWRIFHRSSSFSPRMAVSRLIYARMLIERFPDDADKSCYYVSDLIAPRFVKTIAADLRRGVLKGNRAHQALCLEHLNVIAGYLRLRWRLPFRLFVLPALRIPPLARLLTGHAGTISWLLRRIF